MDSALRVLSHPDDVVGHPDLTLAQKRAILASWASDRRAVEGQPARRRLDSGAIIDVDDVIRALQSLDGVCPAEQKVSPVGVLTLAQAKRDRVATRLRASANDDEDDDPPPVPLGARQWVPSLAAA